MESSALPKKRPHEAPAAVFSKRQKQESGQCKTEHAHSCELASGNKKKYYAVWGGPNPGVHHTGWDVARKWIERFPVKQRSFKTADEASRWYQEVKAQQPTLAFRRLEQPNPSARVSRPPSDDNKSNPPLVPSTQPPRDGPEGLDHVADFIPLEQDLASFKPAPIPYREPIPPNLSNDHPPVISISREPPLSAEQERLVGLVVNERKNVFYTGSAGVGKSRVLKVFRQRLAAMGLKVNVVAPTGKAALDINGQTTWSYAGWIPNSMNLPLDQLRKKAWAKGVKKRLQKTDVLVIDEVSMVENLHLERLNAIMKEVRQNGKAFGGVQVVITGDFCQLPPVLPFQFCMYCGKRFVEKARRSAYECIHCKIVYNDEDKWAFQSKAWKEAAFEHVNLETVFRQRDQEFIAILQKLRLGKPLALEERNLLCQPKPTIDKAVKLFPLKTDVKRINDWEFSKLKTVPLSYNSIDDFEMRNPAHAGLQYYNNRNFDGTLKKLADHRYESRLDLKEGMLVVLLANLSISEGLVNGSQGTVVGFEKFWDETEEHQPDETKIFDIELMLEGEYKDYRADRIFDFMQAAPHKAWPVVKFLTRGQTITVTIKADCYPTEVGDEPVHNPCYSLLSRTQIPLMAAWAMTVHKSQGMTLDKVEVDLSRNFEEGMAYVALSRATTLDGLRVISFPEDAEKGCNEEVRAFLSEKFNIG